MIIMSTEMMTRRFIRIRIFQNEISMYIVVLYKIVTIGMRGDM